MAEAPNRLKIKYGLGRDPTDAEIARWAERVRQFIQLGLTAEAAGDRAAQTTFVDYRTRIYASEADTLQTLLRLAENKK